MAKLSKLLALEPDSDSRAFLKNRMDAVSRVYPSLPATFLVF
jgi:hypothetical protein